MISDEEIAALTSEERHALILRLTIPPTEGHPGLFDLAHVHRRGIALTTVTAIVLVPWTIHLERSLPHQYVAANWTLTWTGFDVILTLTFATTALLALARRQLVVLAAFTSGILLLCDAWFDLTTADHHDRPYAVATAILAEGPIALFLIATALLRLHVMLETLTLLDGHTPLWRVPMLPLGKPSATPRGAPASGAGLGSRPRD